MATKTFTVSISGCLPCCNACDFIMPSNVVDLTTAPYADYSTANVALGSKAPTCLIEQSLLPSGGTCTAGISGDTLGVGCSLDTDAGDRTLVFAYKATLSADVDLNYILVTATDARLQLDLCDAAGTLPPLQSANVEVGVGSFSNVLTVPVSNAGCYFVRCQLDALLPSPSGSIAAVLEFTSSGGMTLANISAAYTNGSGTSYVACVPPP